jgi:hypothetical protein
MLAVLASNEWPIMLKEAVLAVTEEKYEKPEGGWCRGRSMSGVFS